MITVRGILGAHRQRPWLPAVAVGLPAVALVAFLLCGVYAGRQAQYEALRRDELANTQALGVSLDYFLSGLQAEVAELADHREVSACFGDAARGLGLGNGPSTSQLDLETEFDRRLGRRLPGGQPIFDRLVLLDADERVVMDSREPRRSPGAAFTEHWTRPAPDRGGETPVAAGYQPIFDKLVLAAECRVLDRHEGWLLAFVPSATLHAQLQGGRRDSDRRLWLAWDGRRLGSVTPAPPTVARGPSLLSSATTDHFPLTVTRVGTVDGLLASDPRLFLWGLVTLAGVLLGLSAMVWRGQLSAQALTARLAAGAEHARELAARQQELEREIERRLRVEGDLVQARDAAEAASRAKSQFLANMSHEMRTPLNGVLGMTELVLDSRLDDEQREQLEIALESGRSLLSVINDVLDLSGIEAGALRLETVDFDLREELENIRRSFLAGARERGLALAWEVDPDLAARRRGDPVRLRQALVNLLDNALKFTERGTVGLTARADGPAVEFAVHDTGIGVAPEVRELIFEAFQQADGSHTRRYGGAGLGLHLCRRLVRMMGGELALDSRVGAGSTFRFRLDLPVVAEPARTALAPPSPPLPLPAAAPRRLLVAEDNPVNRKLVLSLLQKWGHEVTLAADGVEALAALRAGTFDAVLLDLQMPNLDGIEVARRWRDHERASGLPPLPLIALTARVMPEDEALCREVGIDAHVAKPLDSRALWETLERVAPAACVTAS